MSRKVKIELYEQFSRVTKALSHPKRLEIIDLLSQGEKTVEEIAEHTDLGIKNASAQLKELKLSQLVETRKSGKYVFYSVADSEVVAFWENLRTFTEKKFAEIQKIAIEVFSGIDDIESVSRKTLLSRVKKGEVILLDVRPNSEYESAHLPLAISIPSTELTKRIKELPKDKEIVAYCRGPYCLLAKEAVEILRKKGFKAFRLKDSVHKWSKLRV